MGFWTNFLTNNGGDLAQAGVTAGLGYLNYKNAQGQLKVARESLAETQRMNKWEKEKYNNTLLAQKEGISTLGNAFGDVLQKSAGDTKPQAQNQGNTTQQPQAQNLSLQEQDTLPTQRI